MPRKKKVKPTINTTLDPLEILQPNDDSMEGYEVAVLRADKYKEKRDKIIKYLISGTPLDELMKSSAPGWETGAVYEVYGANNVGKTQLCLTMAVLNPFDVIWIDGGEDTFRPERIMEIARLRGKDPEETLRRIHVIHAINASHLEAICAKLPKMFMQLKKEEIEEKGKKDKQVVGRKWVKSRLTTGKIGLVILDSLAPSFRTQYQGRDRLGQRQRALLRVIMYLRLMSQWFNCVVVVTNQIISDPSGGFAYGPIWYRQKPVGGPTVSHNIDFQILLRPSKQNIRVARVMDSSNTPLREIEFVITERGVEPIKEEE